LRGGDDLASTDARTAGDQAAKEPEWGQIAGRNGVAQVPRVGEVVPGRRILLDPEKWADRQTGTR
jgi:hypothetical protein